MSFVTARDGRRIRVRVLGRGDPCLLLHGFASDGASWLPYLAPFLGRHRFVIPDLRGFGGSANTPLQRDCPLTAYAEDLDDILDALDLPSVKVAGISMGAFVAVQSFRLSGAPRFSRYLHIDQGPIIRNRPGYPHGLMGERQPQFFARASALLAQLEVYLDGPFDAIPRPLRRELGEVFALFCAAAFSSARVGAAVGALVQREAILRRVMPESAWTTHIQIMRAYLERDYDQRDGFTRITVPTTVLVGSGSRMYPAPGQRLIGQWVPHARLCELSGVGHLVPVEAPLRFVKELGRFLQG